MSKFHYTKEDIISSLHSLGLKKGDHIFTHSNLGFFGRLKDAQSEQDYYSIFKEAIFTVIGDSGTLVNPTFSYSFCNNQPYNPNNTPGTCGFFSEMARKDKDSIRSLDANFSISAIGKNSQYFTENPPEHSFGKNSFWQRFLEVKGKFVNFNFDAGSTFIHFVEKSLNVPYRHDKPFTGKIIIQDKEQESVFYHFVYDHQKPEHGPNFVDFTQKAKDLSLLKTANLGKGQIVCIKSTDCYSLIINELKNNPSFLIRGELI